MFAVSEGTNPEEIRNWAIIGVSCFLVAAAIVFAVCMLVRTKKSKSRDLVSPSLLPFPLQSYSAAPALLSQHPIRPFPSP